MGALDSPFLSCQGGVAWLCHARLKRNKQMIKAKGYILTNELTAEATTLTNEQVALIRKALLKLADATKNDDRAARARNLDAQLSGIM